MIRNLTGIRNFFQLFLYTFQVLDIFCLPSSVHPSLPFCSIKPYPAWLLSVFLSQLPTSLQVDDLVPLQILTSIIFSNAWFTSSNAFLSMLATHPHHCSTWSSSPRGALLVLQFMGSDFSNAMLTTSILLELGREGMELSQRMEGFQILMHSCQYVRGWRKKGRLRGLLQSPNIGVVLFSSCFFEIAKRATLAPSCNFEACFPVCCKILEVMSPD